MPRTIAIDATNLFIINYAVNGTLDLNGNPIGGCMGTIRSITNIINALKPQKVIICWDSGGSVQRRSIFKEYKQGRKPAVGKHYTFENEATAKKNLQWQIRQTQEFISFLPLNQIVIDACETDDVTAYLCNHRVHFNLEPFIIVSTDKDFYQLAEHGVGIYNPITKKLITEQSILQDFNIHPRNWLFCKSICGDSSDNIDGIKGFGFKTVAKLFDVKNPSITLTVDDINEELEIKEEKKKLLLENKDLIKRNEKLMSLKDPILSLNQKEKIDFNIKNFSPVLKRKEIYKLIMELGLNLNPLFVNNFVYLTS